MPPRQRARKTEIPTENLLDGGSNELTWRDFERTLRARNRSALTITSYRSALADLANHRPGQDLADLTKNDLTSYFADTLERLAPSTVAIRFRSIHAFYAWCEVEEIIDGHSPMRGLHQPRPDDMPVPVLTDDELRALLAACAGRGFEQVRDAAIIRLWCEPGSPRVAEMAGITVDDLDMTRDEVTVRGKGAKIRSIPFGAKTGTALGRYLRIRRKQRCAGSPKLWIGVKGTNMTVSGLTQMLYRRARMAGMQDVHPHRLRHTAAHVWFAAGKSPQEAMVLFGWSSEEMTRRYGASARVARAHESARRASLGDRL